MNKPIAIIAGEPNSISSEIIFNIPLSSPKSKSPFKDSPLNFKTILLGFIFLNIYSNLNNHFATKNIATNKALTYKTFQIINLINKKVK